MKLSQNFTTLFMYRLGLFVAAFLIMLFLHSQLLAYQQTYYSYLAQLQALQPSIIEDTANIGQAETIISDFGSTTNYYLFIIFGIVPLLFFLAYLLFEWLFWRKFLAGKSFFKKFLVVSIVAMLLLVGLIALFWKILNFENYALNLQVLWFPVIIFIMHYFLLLTYFGLQSHGFKSVKQAFSIGIRKIYLGLPLSLLAFLMLMIAWYGFFVVYTHFEQNVVRLSTYVASFAVLISIAAGIFFTSLFYEKFYMNYFSIKK